MLAFHKDLRVSPTVADEMMKSPFGKNSWAGPSFSGGSLDEFESINLPDAGEATL
jgi:hypothetical protein